MGDEPVQRMMRAASTWVGWEEVGETMETVQVDWRVLAERRDEGVSESMITGSEAYI